MRNETNLVILDACRNNPLAGELARSLGLSRAAVATRGLARVESASGTLIAYATEPGSVAADGTGDHSPYTEALLEHLETPGLSIQDLFTQVTASVLSATGERQKPWTHSSLSKIVRLVPGDDGRSAAAAPPTPAPAGAPSSERLTAEQLAAERVFWESIQGSTSPADIQAYLDRYPGGTYEVLARNRLEALQRPEAPATAPEAIAGSVEEKLGLSRAEHRLVQLGLSAAGHDPGKADGLIGTRTRAALRHWQASRGEPVTGYLDVESTKVLLAAGEQSAARQAKAEAERKREREARQRAQREAEERIRREAEERARREAAAEAERRRRAMEPGRRFRDCPECPEMVVVPAGSFMMGSPASDEGRVDDEGPQHRVTVAEPFAVGVHEVTRGEFARFVRETNRSMGSSCWVWAEGTWAERSGRSWRNPGFAQTDRHPVVCVSWEDARAYVRWLSGKTDQRYRLLSESEWEYVARARTRTARYWGESESGQCRHANGADASTAFEWRVSCNDGHARTSPVGTYTGNGFGLQDVLGNVWEWTQDCRNDGYGGAPGDGRAWEQGDCRRRGVRGGSWFDLPRLLRAASRVWYTSGVRDGVLGFRIARTLTP